MGSVNFKKNTLGVAVGMLYQDEFTEADRANWCEVMNVDRADATDDFIYDQLYCRSVEFVDEHSELAEHFAGKLNAYIKYWLFGEIPSAFDLQVDVEYGHYNGWRLRVVSTDDPDNFNYEAFKKAWLDDFAEEELDKLTGMTVEQFSEWTDLVFNFAQYAILRYGYAKGLVHISGGYCGGSEVISADDLKEFAHFEKYRSKLAIMWRDFYNRFDKTFNKAGV